MALQLALDAPEVVHSLVLLEPGLLDVPSGPAFAAAVEPAFRMYQAGDKEGATDASLRVAIGPAYRSFLDELIPGAYAQVLADADTVFAVEMPSLGEWRFTREDARRITQPVLAVLGSESAKDWAGWPEVQARVQEWMPQAEPFVLAGANHALEEMDPRGVAEAMAAFFARHPIPAPPCRRPERADGSGPRRALPPRRTPRYGGSGPRKDGRDDPLHPALRPQRHERRRLRHGPEQPGSQSTREHGDAKPAGHAEPAHAARAGRRRRHGAGVRDPGGAGGGAGRAHPRGPPRRRPTRRCAPSRRWRRTTA